MLDVFTRDNILNKKSELELIKVENIKEAIDLILELSDSIKIYYIDINDIAYDILENDKVSVVYCTGKYYGIKKNIIKTKYIGLEPFVVGSINGIPVTYCLKLISSKNSPWICNTWNEKYGKIFSDCFDIMYSENTKKRVLYYNDFSGIFG